MTITRKLALIALTAIGLSSSPAQAGVGVVVGFGGPHYHRPCYGHYYPYRVYVAPPPPPRPVYVYPAPHYVYPPPVYVQPAPVVYAAPPAPAVAAPAPTIAPPPPLTTTPVAPY